MYYRSDFIELFLQFHRKMKELDKTRIKSDADAVANIMELVDTMINPFDNEYQSLVHLSNVAPIGVATDMKNMHDKGEAAAMSYMKTNILSSKPDIYTPIKKLNLRTFSSVHKKITSKTKNGEIVALKNSKKLFSKMVLIAQNRDLDMKDVLQYSLRPFPSPLATVEGHLVKTAKSKLLNLLESEMNDAYVKQVDGESALIIDAMAILQTIKINVTTFDELAHELLTKIVKMAIFSNAKRIDFVGDRYPVRSIKNLERNKRSEGETLLVKIYGGQQRVPRQWKKFMSTGKNKEELMKFLFEAWKKSSPQLLKGVEVFITHGEDCHKLTESPNTMICSHVEELTCDHEEADTRMVCHAKNASLNYPNVIINSPDTDVFLIALNACSNVTAQLFFETGKQANKRIISLEKVKQHVGPEWCSALIGFHSFTGMIKIKKVIIF